MFFKTVEILLLNVTGTVEAKIKVPTGTYKGTIKVEKNKVSK